MTLSAKSEPGLGHNNPPTLLETLAQTHGLKIDEVEPIAGDANKLPAKITSPAERDTAADIARQAGDLAKTLTKLHKVEKEPHLFAGRTVDDFFNPNIKRLDRISSAMLDRIDAFNRDVRRKADEERRRQEEEQRRMADAARQAAEAAAKAGRTEDAVEDLKEAAAAETAADDIALAPAANVADQIKATTDSGTKIGTRKEWTYEVLDYDAVDLNKLKLFIKRDAIDAALRTYVRNNHDRAPIEGIRFFEDERATARR